MTETTERIITNDIEEIIINYIEESVTEEIRDEFINAAIHFVINEELFKEFDLMRIKYKIEKIDKQEVTDCLKLSAIYGYIIYRTVVLKLVNEELQSKCCEVFLEISKIVTDYLTMKTDEEELFTEVEAFMNKLGVSSECNKFVLERIENKNIEF